MGTYSLSWNKLKRTRLQVAADDSELGKCIFFGLFSFSRLQALSGKGWKLRNFTYFSLSWQHPGSMIVSFLFFLSGKLARYYAAKVLRSPTVGITDGDDGSGRLLLGAKSSTNARNSWTGHTLLLGLFFSLFVLYGYICRERAFLCGG